MNRFKSRRTTEPVFPSGEFKVKVIFTKRKSPKYLYEQITSRRALHAHLTFALSQAKVFTSLRETLEFLASRPVISGHSFIKGLLLVDCKGKALK